MLTIGELFAGYGGLGMGVADVLPTRTAWVADYDRGPCKVLAHRFPDVPNLRDVTAVDWAAVEPVDIIAGGSPCQDLSHAGKRTGMTAGTRSNLWVAMRDAIATIRPRLVVWENVRGAYSAAADSALEQCPGCVGDGSGPDLRALGRVLGDLSDLGYDCRWHGLRAADVGAPHGRFRIFVVATPADGERRIAAPGQAAGGWAQSDTGRPDRMRVATDAAHIGHQRGGHSWIGRHGSANSGADAAADTERGRRDGRPHEPLGQPVGGTTAAGSGADPATDTNGAGRSSLGRLEPIGRDAHRRGRANIVWGDYEPAIRRWEHTLGRPAPDPTVPGPRGGMRLSALFVEWMMGLPAGWVTDVPDLTRNEQLKLLGNGVVPQQASAAIRHLMTVERVA